MSVYDWEKGAARRRGGARPSPLFLTVVAVTALGAGLAWAVETPGSRLGDFGVFLFVLGGWVMSVCFHEFAHAYSAYRAGDRSVEARGYLTLNPFKYTHPALSILFPLIAIVSGGFALPGGAVYLNPHAFRTKAQRSLAAAVGPLTNVVLALVLIQLAESQIPVENGTILLGAGSTGHLRLWTAVAFLGQLQLTAAVLNLLPVPGLDGYGIIEPYLAPETVRAGDKIKPWGLLIVIALLLWSGPVRNVFFDVVNAIYRAFGGHPVFASIGYQYFRWWTKVPW